MAERTGRVLLLGAVAFWWGLIVVPRLVSLAFPELLSPDAIPRHLNPDQEGTVANAVSAGALLTAGVLAFVNALRSFGRLGTQDARRTTNRWIAVGGWAALAVTLTYLAWDEVSEFHTARTLALGREVLGIANNQYLWPVVLSPLILVFVLAMGVFVSKGFPSTGSAGSWQASSGREVRALLILGLTAWLLAVAHEASYLFLFAGRAEMLEIVLEETLEFGGTLLIGISASIALGSEAVSRVPDGALRGRRLFLPLFGSMAAVAVLGGLAVALLFSAPFVNARARTHIGAFHIIFYDKHSLVQELGVLPAPPARFDLRITSRAAPQGRSGVLIWRVMEAGKEAPGSGRILREGRKEVPARDHPSWESIDFPPLVEAEGRPLALQLIADVGPRAHLLVGATKTNRYQDGRLWVDGALTWPDQNIEFVAYSAPEPTRGKLQAMWHIFSSDWRWPVLAVDVAIVMTLLTFIPALLVTAALPRRGLRW